MDIARPVTHLLVALPCEAKPLIRHYRLKRRMSEEVFPVYERGDLLLTVSGVGKTAMAAAVAYAHLIAGANRHSVWLNVGVAGHRTRSLGEACVAHKITDADSGKRWYPPLIEQPPCADESLCTVSRPRLDYPEPVLYDMEASGFYEAATRFSTSELVQCIKVVSDNGESPASQINASQICAWIENRACLVDTLLQQLQALARPLQQHHPGLLAQCLGRWHFTAQQRLQLERLLSRWEVLAPDEPPTMQVLSDAKQAKDVLHRLRQQLDGLPITFT